MEENVRDLIYLNSKRYISIQSLHVLYWAISIIPFIMITWGVVALNTIGLNWRSLFPLISISVWSLLYWIFVLTVQKKRKKTFELRFLVNGILGLLISSLFWILYTSLSLLKNDPLVDFNFFLCVLLFYLFSSILYIGSVVLGVHKGIFKKIKENSQTPKTLAITAFFTSILPITGVLGMYTSRMLHAHTSTATQNFIGTIALITMIFLPILAHINFVQYFYCKKHKISCDEYGNTTSPNLEYHKKQKKKTGRAKRVPLAQPNTLKGKSSKSNIQIKILVGILVIPMILILIVCLVFFVKGFLKGIS